MQSEAIMLGDVLAAPALRRSCRHKPPIIGGKLLIDYTVEVEQSMSSRNAYEIHVEPIEN